MKKILTLVLVSALGGIMTLGAYKLCIEKEAVQTVETTAYKSPTYIPTTTNSTFLTSEERPNLVTAANNTIDAVVHVKNTAVSKGYTTFQDLISGRPSERKQEIGAGSGVIISSDGHIITNNHVIKGAVEISITLNDNKTYMAEVIGTDPKTDIALLKIDADDALPFVAFGDSDNTQIGEWVLAVGNPFNLTSTVTAGIISAKSRDLTGLNEQSFIQTDAAVNPGNSGGALVNTNGELVGINTAISSRTGSYIGYSFAVPSNIARKVIEDILEFGDVQNVMLGISALNKDSQEALDLGVNEIEGIYISDVEENSGAKIAGIKSGDIIKRLDNVEITKFSELKGYLKSKSPDDVVNVEVLRDDTIKSIPVTLTKSKTLSVDFMNMELKDISEKVKSVYDTDHGVMVKETQNAWLYKNLGISPGYIITKINDKKIASIEDIKILKKEYGSNFEDQIVKLEYINRNLEKKEVIFK